MQHNHKKSTVSLSPSLARREELAKECLILDKTIRIYKSEKNYRDFSNSFFIK